MYNIWLRLDGNVMILLLSLFLSEKTHDKKKIVIFKRKRDLSLFNKICSFIIKFKLKEKI